MRLFVSMRREENKICNRLTSLCFVSCYLCSHTQWIPNADALNDMFSVSVFRQLNKYELVTRSHIRGIAKLLCCDNGDIYMQNDSLREKSRNDKINFGLSSNIWSLIQRSASVWVYTTAPPLCNSLSRLNIHRGVPLTCRAALVTK